MGKLTDEEILQRRIEPLDYSPSSGSIGTSRFDDGKQDRMYGEKTHTTFRVSEAPNDDHRDWKSMNDVQDGKYADDNNTRKVHADQTHDLEIFMENVKLRPQEKFYAKNLLKKLHRIERDRDGNGSFYGNGDALLLAVLTFAANHHDRRIRQKNSFKDLRNSLNVERESVRTERQHIREKI